MDAINYSDSRLSNNDLNVAKASANKPMKLLSAHDMRQCNTSAVMLAL